MSTKKLIITIVLIALLINFVCILGYYFATQNFQITIPATNGVIPKVVDRKIIEQRVEEYTKISDVQNDIIKAANQAGPSVVSIIISKDLQVYFEDPNNFFGGYVTEKKEKVGGGSGIIVSSDGFVITNKHVVEDTTADYSVVTKDGDTYKVDKIRLDPILDIAMLKVVDDKGQIPQNLVSADINTYKSEIKVGQFVIAIGNALAQYENTVTFGIISGKNRQLDPSGSNGSVYLGLYQTDAPINQGNSGGPLLDIDGGVIGINTAITAVGQGIGFAIPISKEFVTSTLDVIKKNGKITRPFMGIGYKVLNKSLAKSMNLDKFEGIYVESVVPNSFASSSGLQKGDVITEIEGVKISYENNFLYQLYTYKPGDKIDFVIYRNKEYKKITMQLGENTGN